MAAKNYRDLIAWQKGMDLVEQIYGITKTFPKDEIYGLTTQIRRAVVSIPSNIAEGEGRTSEKEFLNFLPIAYGSLREVETQVIISERLQYIDGTKAKELLVLCSEIGKIINGLRKSLQ